MSYENEKRFMQLLNVLNLAEISRQTGISAQVLKNYRNGRTNISLENAVKLNNYIKDLLLN